MVGATRSRRISARPRILLGAFTLVLTVAIGAGGQATPKRSEVSVDEYRVYNTVLDNMQFPQENVHVLIFNKTLDFSCNESDGLPLANDCSFLAVPPNTPTQVKELLQSSWPHMEPSTWGDFEKENATSAGLQDSLNTSWKHKLDGTDIVDKGGKEWSSPDFELFFSRVGFDSKKTEAMVYVLLFSYVDNVHSAGDYFRFRLNKKGQWEINGRVRYFETDPAQSKDAR
jgi:hypothetical protein